MISPVRSHDREGSPRVEEVYCRRRECTFYTISLRDLIQFSTEYIKSF